MKKMMILLAAMAMTTLAIQADEAQQPIEVTATSMDADTGAVSTDTTKPSAEDDKNTTEEVTPKS